MAGSSIGTLKAFLTLDPSGFVGGFGVAGKAASGFVGGIGSKIIGNLAGIGMAAVGAGAGLITAGVGFHGLFESLERVGGLSTTAKKFGLTVEETQKLGIAASQTGLDMDTLSHAMFLMGKNIGSGGMSMDKRFLQVADAIAQIKDPAERGAMALKIFGKSGDQLLPLLMKGSQGIKRSADAIDRFGLGFSNIDAAKAKEAVLTLHEFKTVLGGIKDKLAVEMAPAVTSFFQTWLDGLEVTMRKMEEFKLSMAPKSGKGNSWISGGGVFGTGASLMDMLVASIAFGGNVNEDILRSMAEGREAGARDKKNKALTDAMNSRGALKGLGGGEGGGEVGATGKKFSSAFERGSVGAVSAITNSGGNAAAELLATAKEQKVVMIEMKRELEKLNRDKKDKIVASRLFGGGAK